MPSQAAAADKQQAAAPTATTALTLPANLPQNDVLAAYEGTLEEIYNRVNPSVVNIRVVQKNNAADISGGNLPQLPFFNFPNQPNQPNTPQYSEGLGSGFVWDTEGHIVTNNHVIDGADKIEVTFADGTVLPAKVVGADSYSDLAVIQVDAKSVKLQPIQPVDSNTVKVGQLAIAIGNPFGLSGTMTVGIVSALGRTIPAGDTSSQGPVYSIPDIIQTDAPINPGNSGGVLLNDQGQLIGVTAAIESTVGANAGIGFAIPSAIVQRVVPALIKSGSYQHPFLGISGTTLSLDMAKAMNLPDNTHGALVVEVVPNGPADKAGIRGSDRQVTIDGQNVRVGGDVIIKIDDTPVHTMDDIIAYLSDHTDVGQTVKLTVLRDGKEKALSVKLEARPANNQTSQNQGQASLGVWMGISAVPLNAELDKALNLPENTRGLLIQQVESGSPADEAGLRGGYKPISINGEQILLGGDILTKVDGQEVNTLAQLQRILADKNAGDQINITIIRDGQEQELSLTLA
ncbi:MAG: PDZ domain-containing protein, partial [Anaerolineales bacterium]